MKKCKTVSALILTIVMGAAMVACGTPKTAETPKEPAKAEEPAKATEPAKAEEPAKTADAGEKKAYTIGWSTIYLTPTWMQQTDKMMNDRIDYWKSQGIIGNYTVANANGDSNLQASQIENMISQKYDAIIVVAGSATALDAVCEKAVDAGIVVINYDSLVSTDKVTSKINTDQVAFGGVSAQWMVDELDGKGEIICMNGPAGVAVSEERWKGAKAVFDKYPDIKVVTTTNTEYNEGPAMQAILPVLSANPNVNGIWTQGGALASASIKALQQKGMKMIPITGENYNGYMKLWEKEIPNGFSSIALGQPNWLGVLSIDQAVRALQGHKVDPMVIVDLPVITNDNIGDYMPNDLPDDYFAISDIGDEEINKILGPVQ